MSDASVITHHNRVGTPDVLSVDAVRFRFGGVVALDGVTFAVAPGEVLGLIGPNGAGKTTLLDCISGHNTPDAGTISMGGRDITGLAPVARARLGLGRTFQRQQLFGWLTVEQNLLVPLEWPEAIPGLIGDLVRWPGRTKRVTRHRAAVHEALERVGISHLADRVAGTLPIGQARLVEFARAIVQRPALLLFDEPTSGLAERDTQRLGGLIREVVDDATTGVVLVEHDIPFVMHTADAVLALHLGRVLAHGSPAEVQSSPEVRAAYLGDA